jgi:exo-beta-1,3-glucanase (GH17 family)
VIKRWLKSFFLGFIFLVIFLGCTPLAPAPTPTTSLVPVHSTSTLTLSPPTPTQARSTPTATPFAPLRGLAYSPYRDCQSADTKAQPSRENVMQDLAIIREMANGIRTYSSTGINAEIPALARGMGLRVSAGAWLGKTRQPMSAKSRA